jgi:hypothetical protein
VEPFPQKRGARNCRACTICAYCATIDGPHDHDHAPIPWRHGGREVIPSCVRLKDRIHITRWPPASHDALQAGTQGFALLVSQLCAAMRDSPDCDPGIPRDAALRALNACTTAEARIGVARMVAISLDVAEQRRASGALEGIV